MTVFALLRRTGPALLALAASACDGNPTEPNATTLQVRPALVRTVEGATMTFDARFFADDGAPARGGAVRWLSLDADVLAVDGPAGTALAPGWARVIASADERELADTALVAVGIAFTGVAAGAGYGCGWNGDGRGWCWGGSDGFYGGVLGAGTGEPHGTPAPIAGTLAFSRIAAGETHTCGIAADGVYCWGYNRGLALGGFGCGASACDVPIRILAGTWTDVSVPAFYDRTTCATGPDGLTCWGTVAYGALGIDPPPCSPYCSPRRVSTTLTGDVAMGRYHGCALDGEGRAFCWGDHRLGQLGIGATAAPGACTAGRTPCAYSPVPVATSARFTRLESGRHFTCGLTADGRVFCWGDYALYDGGLQPGGPGPTPVEVGGELRFATIAAGWSQACGVSTAGDLYCWGEVSNASAMGDPALTHGERVTTPRRIDARGLRFTAVAVGSDHACAVAQDGTIRCIGSGSGLGQGTTVVERSAPIPVAPPGPVPSTIDLP